MNSLNYIRSFLVFVVYFFFTINSSYSKDNSNWFKINKEGMVAFKERNFIKAESLYIQAIEEAKKSKLDGELSATLNNLGLLKTELLQFQEAEKLITESLRLRLEYYGVNHRYVAQSYNNLARVYESTELMEESIELYIKAIKVYESLGNRYSMLLARTLINLSTVQLNLGLLDIAQINLVRALALSKKFKGDNIVSLSAMSNLAALFVQKGNYIEAEEIYLRLIKIRKNTEGSKSISLARVLNNLAVLYKKNCKYDLAFPYIAEAVNIWDSLQSKDKLNHAKAYHNQGELYKAQGKYDLAIKSFKTGISIIKEASNILYEQYLEQSYALINLYIKIGKLSEANILIKNINIQNKNNKKEVITRDSIPEEVFEECSSSNI
jgi:tetratricopeptide (TPR) repeat protein